MDTMGYPVQEGKLRYIYEAILSDTKSVEFTHKYVVGKTNEIQYSKAIIKEIISSENWGTHPLRTRTMFLKPATNTRANAISYNYWDYVQAWTNIFYYQNGEKRHSWFFKLCTNLMANNVPNWFVEWWGKFGPGENVFPESIQKEIKPFCQYHPQLRGSQPEGKSFLFFMIEMSIPWIWRWDVELRQNNIGLPILARTFHYKWWTRGMDNEETLNEVREKN
jgi:hypothetical protein